MAANIPELLHDLWAADETLNGLLPSTQVFTGRAPRGTSLPYASITNPAGAGAGQSSLHRYRQDSWRVQVWCERHDEGEAIQRAIEDCFINYDGGLDTGGIIRIGHDSSFHLQEEKPTTTLWQFVVQLDVLVERPRTD